jgi:4-hydroxy-3-polyprenylbenzoate decarboxylase
MAHRDLRDFLAALDAAGELRVIDVATDPELEIATVTDLHSKAARGGKALLFRRVKGSRYPVATNLFGSYARMAAALGAATLDELSRRVESLLDCPDSAPQPVLIGNAPCHEVVSEPPSLLDYPFLKSWPGDGGRFLTLPLVFTSDPESGATNCGMYRVRIFDDSRAGIRWKPGSGGFCHHQKYQAAGERMPVAIVVGAAPSLTLAATLPLPDPFDELSFAGFLDGEPVEMTRCLSVPLSVPARAELVIEGFIDPEATLPEGGFGNHTGRYDPGEQVPVMTVTCITHRRDPVCQATVVGPPPMEDCYMAKAAERLLLPFSQRECPEIVDVTLPLEGIFHGCALVSIRKRAPGEGRRVLEKLRRGGWLKRGKLLVIVDAAGEPLTVARGFWQALNQVDLERDLLFSDGCLGVDATRKLPEEGGDGDNRELKQDPELSASVRRRWKEFGLSTGEEAERLL